jgi:hypothetical protein
MTKNDVKVWVLENMLLMKAENVPEKGTNVE